MHENQRKVDGEEEGGALTIRSEDGSIERFDLVRVILSSRAIRIRKINASFCVSKPICDPQEKERN